MIQYLLLPVAMGLAGAMIPTPMQEDIDKTATTVTTETIETDEDRLRRLTVPVNIGERGPYAFLIDTGSERTAISTSLATRLQLERSEPAMLVSVAGSKVVDTAWLPGVKLGTQDYGELLAPLLESAHMGADGILGLDGLQGQRVLFNFKAGAIEIEQIDRKISNRGFEIVIRAHERSGQLIITDARLDGIDVRVVIDTGAESSIGNRALQQRLIGKRSRGLGNQTNLVSVTGQEIVADVGIAPDLQIGRAKLSQIPIAFADSPTFAHLGLDDKPSLFLGMSALRGFERVAIDFGERKVLFDVAPPNRMNHQPTSTIKF